jgi:hypothetical protein
MKIFAKTERNAIGQIPTIAGIDPVAVEPATTVVVPFNIEHVRIAAKIVLIRVTSSDTPPLEFLGVESYL